MSEFHFPAGRHTGIAVMDDAFDADLIELLYLFMIDAMPEIGTPGMTLGGHMPDIKNSTDIQLSTRADWTGDWSPEALRAIGYDLDELDLRIANRLSEIINAYSDVYLGLKNCTLQDTGYQFQKYDCGAGFYTVHLDGRPSSHHHRVLAMVIYLNTVAEGGETFFPDHRVGVKPVAGRIAIFPAHWLYPHQSLVPLSDDKYIISTFITTGDHFHD